MTPLHHIRGFTVVLHYVRNVYPVEKADVGWEWGFKFTDGFYETFHYSSKKEAQKNRSEFVNALTRYWSVRESKT